jgi:hypothetical protein
MPERENPPLIWFKIGKTEGILGEYRGFFLWEEVIDKLKPLVQNDGSNLFVRSPLASHALECKEFFGPRSIYLYWGDEFGKMENPISDAEVVMLNTACFQGTLARKINRPMQKIKVPVVFKGVVTVDLDPQLPVADAAVLARNIALARVLAVVENPDAPEEEAFEDYVEKASETSKSRADKDWDSAQLSISGAWTAAKVEE